MSADIKKTKDKKSEIVRQMNEKFAVIKISGQVLIMDTSGQEPEYMKQQDFVQWHRNKYVWIDKVDEDGEVKKKKMQVSSVWLDSPDRREYKKVIFKPGAKPEDKVYNLWQGFTCEPKEGDCKLFYDHIFNILCDNNLDQYEFFLKWCACVVMHCINPIQRRPEIALVLKGIKGIGKDTFADLFGSLFGVHYACVSQEKHLFGEFNSSLQHNILCHASETFWAGDKKSEGRFKNMITNKDLFFTAKYRNPIKLDSHLNFIVSSNEDWVVPAGAHERRFFVPTLSENKQSPAYYSAIRKQWNNGGKQAFLWDCINDTLFNDDDFRSPPQTEGLKQQVQRSMNLTQQFWAECLEDEINLKWAKSISSVEMYNLFINFCNGINNKARIERQGNFTKSLCKESGCLKSQTVWVDGVSVRGFKLPSLQEARESFNKQFGMELF